MNLPPLSPEQSIKPAFFEWRLRLLFIGLFLSSGIHLPYFPLWLDMSGFSATEIAMILGAPLFLRIFTGPLVSAFADRARDRVNVLTGLVAGGLVLSLGYFLDPAYGLVLAISIGLGFFWSPQAPIVDSLALSGVRRFGSDYASMRIWGSIAFLVASLIGGAVLNLTDARFVPVMLTASFALFLAAVLAAPRLGRPRIASPLPLTALEGASAAVFTRPFILLVLGAGIINGSHGLQYAFSSIYWRSLDLSETQIGLLWGSGVLAEILALGLYRRLFAKVSATRVLLLAGLAGLVRWSLFPLIWPLGLGVAGFYVLQALHAASLGFVVVGVQMVIIEAVSEARTGAAQGMALFANSFTIAAVTLASGPLYAWFGAYAYFFAAAIAGAGGLLVLAAGRSTPQGG